MITANFIHRTFRIGYGSSAGTAFTADIDDRQYLVTARHVVQGLTGQDALQVFGNGTWSPVPVHLVGHADGDIDVSVLAASVRLTPAELPIELHSSGVIYGQDVFFLGFPYGMLGNVVFSADGYPLPFVKRAIVSCFAGDIYYLDGHNNPGFSGGPVVFGPPGAPAPTTVAAVVSGYRFKPEPVYQGDVETELTYRYNTGIIVAYAIDHAVALINANPIGLPI